MRLFYFVCVVLFSVYAQAADLTVAWDANTEPDLAGYIIYIGEASGDYSTKYDMRDAASRSGLNTNCPDPYDPFETDCCEFTLENLKHGKTYYLAATAYDDDDNESAYSDELIHTVIDVTPPNSPKQLSVKDAKLLMIPTIKTEKQLVIEAVKKSMQTE